jgi:hypothetical protein
VTSPDREFKQDSPNVARIYDYLLGGKENYVADRIAAAKLTATWPDPTEVARCIGENRAFLRRAVQYLAGVGIRQFLDIGAGLPTQGNVHEIAHRVAPEARVGYVDNDPVVVAHGRALLAKSPQVRIAQADLREPARILQHPVVRELIDFDRPVAILLVAILHFIADHEDPAGIVTQLREALPAGSYLVISHGIGETRPRAADAAEAVYNTASAQLTLRSYADLESFFKGFELVEPGLVDVTEWHPDRAAAPATIAAGVGLKV